MSDAPERIWALPQNSERDLIIVTTKERFALRGAIPYVRASDYDARAAKLAEVEAERDKFQDYLRKTHADWEKAIVRAEAAETAPADPLADERVKRLVEALKEGRRAIGEHHAPHDCYSTGPLTGDAFRDLVQCPACSFIAMHDAALAAIKAQP